jgi:hypothetical protein
VQKISFQPDVNLDLAISEIVAATNFIRSLLPAGIQASAIAPLVTNAIFAATRKRLRKRPLNAAALKQRV